MPFDGIEPATVKSTGLDENKCVTAELTNIPGDDWEGCTVHQPAGLQSRPRDGKADALYSLNGDLAEVLAIQDVGAVKKLAEKIGTIALGPAAATATQAQKEKAGEIAKGESRLHSVGDSPQAILMKDSEIKVGVGAEKGAARDGDEVDCGSLIKIPGMGGLSDIKYVEPGGQMPVPPPDPVNVIALKGKIKTASTLVKIE